MTRSDGAASFYFPGPVGITTTLGFLNFFLGDFYLSVLSESCVKLRGGLSRGLKSPMVIPDYSEVMKSMIVRIGVSMPFSESSMDLNLPLFRVIASVPLSFPISISLL